MYSYKLYIFSQYLKDTHIFLNTFFNTRYNNTQVNLAAFDQGIPKFI
jgi:hypothetical protein